MGNILSRIKVRNTMLIPEGKETVKDLIEEIKNLSELMLDLAYSSVFFESKEIAEEVNLLFERLEVLEEHLYIHLFAASRGRDAKKLISVIELVESARLVASAATNISSIVTSGHAMHPIVKDALKESDTSIIHVSVSDTSIMANNTLGELRLATNAGVDIVAMRRDRKWIFDPKKHTVIKKGDIMIGIGPKNSCRKLKALAEGTLKKI